jgi:signal transduction histidine kinase
MDEIFARNIIIVFFFYGLAFFSMGLAILLEISHNSELDYAQSLKALGLFGIIHGAHEWFEMVLIIHSQLVGEIKWEWVNYLRLFLLTISFLFLIAFGLRLILGPGGTRKKIIIMVVIIVLWYLGLYVVLQAPYPTPALLIKADVYTRYSLAIPGATMTAWGLILQRKSFEKYKMRRFSMDVTIAAIAFALYGGIGQLFVSQSDIFPSSYLNSDLFMNIFGFPIQGFRALMAIVAAVFIIDSLRVFDEENRRRIQDLSDAQKADEKRLKELRIELLLRTVNAQELERKRIARELHDDTGQTLTAIGLGLQAMSQTITKNPQRAIQHSSQLQRIANDGLINLQRMVSGLHPPQLDELGIVAALRRYALEINQIHHLSVNVTGAIDDSQISDETRLTMFRIAQEAITNSVRHSRASTVLVNLEENEDEIMLRIDDDGAGFDVENTLQREGKRALGLLGMIERANLINGSCQITSNPAGGTTVEVRFYHDK